jgi:hypothetical protein
VKILYLSAPAGARKTQAIVEFASQSVCEGQKTLIVQPTIALVEDTEDRLRQHDPSALVLSIHSGKLDGSVAAISNHLAKTHSDGETLLICQEGFDQLPSFPRREEWNIIFDEVPKLDIRHEHNIPKSHRVITDYLSVEGSKGRYSRLNATDPATLRAMALNRVDDEVWGKLQPLAQCLCSADWDTYVLTENYEKLLAGKNEKFTAYSVRKPSGLSGFKSVRFASALFENSLLCHAWKSRSVEFAEDKELRKALAFSEHLNGHLLTIKYTLPGRWSKYRRNQAGIERLIVNAFRDALGNRKHSACALL